MMKFASFARFFFIRKFELSAVPDLQYWAHRGDNLCCAEREQERICDIFDFHGKKAKKKFFFFQLTAAFAAKMSIFGLKFETRTHWKYLGCFLKNIETQKVVIKKFNAKENIL